MKVQWSGIGIVQASGKLGDEVFARTKHGSYSRKKGATVNPQTQYQTDWRQYLTDADGAWQSLTADQIDAWNRYTIDIPRSRYLPSQSPCSGHRAFVRQYTLGAFTGFGFNQDPPATQPPLYLVDLLPKRYDTNTEVSLLVDVNPDPSDLLVWATPPIAASRRYWKNRIRLLCLVAGAATGTIDITSEYLHRFPAPVTGEWAAFVVQTINRNTMALGPPLLVTQTCP